MVVLCWYAKLGDLIVSSPFFREVRKHPSVRVRAVTVDELVDMHREDFGCVCRPRRRKTGRYRLSGSVKKRPPRGATDRPLQTKIIHSKRSRTNYALKQRLMLVAMCASLHKGKNGTIATINGDTE